MTIRGFSSGENCVSAAVNYTIYGTSTKLLFVGQDCKLAKDFVFLKYWLGQTLYSLVYDKFFQRSNVGGRNKNKNKMSQNKVISILNMK